MVGICCYVGPSPTLQHIGSTSIKPINSYIHLSTSQLHSRPYFLQRTHGIRCCSNAPNTKRDTDTPQLLKFAVSGVTQLLRLFSFRKDRLDMGFSLLQFMLKIVYLKIRLLNSVGINSEKSCVLATWKLRTYLKLPWRPLISIEGSTVYDLDDEFKIVRHAESWNVSALEAVGQIFSPSFGSPGE